MLAFVLMMAVHFHVHAQLVILEQHVKSLHVALHHVSIKEPAVMLVTRSYVHVNLVTLVLNVKLPHVRAHRV